MSKKPLCVAILWHMHQPDYSDAQTGEFRLPWTRFHAVKDYFDMGALAAEVPGMHLTINVVPSLIDQLVSYAQGTARETHAQLTLRNASELREEEKAFLLRDFFQLNWKHMVLPYARYKELSDRRGHKNESGVFAEGLKRFSERDYRDLQVWYNLSWCGRELRRDPDIARLFAKGRGFTEEEKRSLLERQIAFAGRILPLYRELNEAHGIELSVSPYYHPILPLLCDSRSAREALPGVPLPVEPFSYPADAAEQILRARQRFHEVFGNEAQGMWPSEGSVSDAALMLARQAGVSWLASDEGVLSNSLRKCGRWKGSLLPGQRYSAYRWGDGTEGPCLFFRDHGLSDLIGFTYAAWDAKEAASDFISHLRSIRDSLPDDGRHYIVPIILDGENAWEHYTANGTDFLLSLYKRLVESDGLRPVSFSEFLALEAAREALESVVAGSWIYSNLATWIGHPEKNRAWEALTVARRFLESGAVSRAQGDMREKACRAMFIAEGSDWFWWYGDDHQTDNAAEFDELFRNRVKDVYRTAGREYPLDLDIPIKKADTRAQFRTPVHTITPRLDGKVSGYYEWLSAGFASPPGGGSMHRSDRQFEMVYFGFDASRFYLRVDLRDLKKDFPPQRSVHIRFLSPVEYFVELQRDEQKQWHCRTVRSTVPDLASELAVDRIIELGIPLKALGIQGPDEVEFFILLSDMGRELERFPASGFLTVPVDPWGLDQEDWMV